MITKAYFINTYRKEGIYYKVDPHGQYIIAQYNTDTPEHPDDLQGYTQHRYHLAINTKDGTHTPVHTAKPWLDQQLISMTTGKTTPKTMDEILRTPTPYTDDPERKPLNQEDYHKILKILGIMA